MQRNCPPGNMQNKVCADCKDIYGIAPLLCKLRLLVLSGHPGQHVLSRP